MKVNFTLKKIFILVLFTFGILLIGAYNSEALINITSTFINMLGNDIYNVGNLNATGTWINGTNFNATGQVDASNINASMWINSTNFNATGNISVGQIYANNINSSNWINGTNFNASGNVNASQVFQNGIQDASSNINVLTDDIWTPLSSTFVFNPTLTSQSSIPEQRILIYYPLTGSTLQSTIINPGLVVSGTATVSTADRGILGEWNLLSSTTSPNNNTGVSVGVANNISSNFYNESKTRKFSIGILPSDLVSQVTEAGVFSTFVNRSINTTRSGIFFNFSANSNNPTWWAWICKNTTPTSTSCTSNNTQLAVLTTAFAYLTIEVGPDRGQQASWVGYWINGTLVSNFTNANLDFNNAASWIGYWTEAESGTARNTRIDYIFYEADR